MTNRDPKIEKIENLLDKLGNTAVESFHYVALFIIGCMVMATLVSKAVIMC